MCGVKTNLHKAEQDKQLIQFLMGLNEVYTVVRGNILMMNPLPTIAQGFSILIQEEKQREVRAPNKSISESSSLNVGAQNAGRNQFRTKINTKMLVRVETNLTEQINHRRVNLLSFL